MVLTDHHGDGRFAIWCAAPGASRRCSSTPTRTSSSSRRTSATAAGSACASTEGVDWDELAGIAEDAFAEIAPARLVAAAARAG